MKWFVDEVGMNGIGDIYDWSIYVWKVFDMSYYRLENVVMGLLFFLRVFLFIVYLLGLFFLVNVLR